MVYFDIFYDQDYSKQGCSQTKWETVYGMGTQTRFVSKIIYNLVFVI